MADDVLHSGVRGITDLIVMPGLINRDFADIKTVMSEMGKAMMGTGEMDGEGRALKAAEAAISNPLLDDVSMKGARAVLVNVTGGPDLMLFEVDEAVNRIRAEVDPDANILFGSALREDMEGRVRVSVVATGIDAEACARSLGDNVQTLNVRRKEAEAVFANALTRAHFEPIAPSPVHQQVVNLAQEFAPLPEAIAAQEPAPSAPLPDEPMNLGTPEAPMLEEPPAEPQGLREFAREPSAQPQERRGMFSGLFGGRRRAERTERTDPPLERPRASAMPQAPTGRASAMEAPAPAPQSPQSATRARTAEQRPQAPAPAAAAAPAGDLFAGAAEDDRFEIPAFLRRQAKTGS